MLECGNVMLKNGYKVKILNTINFKKSMHYNPFAYVHSEKDILKLVTTLMTNTKGEGSGGDPFWEKSERLLLTALIAYLHYEAPVEEQNFATLLEMLNTMQVLEDDEEYQNPVDLLFEELAKKKPNSFAGRQYGVAWATVAAQVLSWLCSIWYIRRYAPELEFPLLPRQFDKTTLRKMIKIGLPLGMNTALYSTGHLILQVLFNLQGSTFVAGCSVAGKITSIANIAITSLSSTMTVFSGQNLGAENHRRLCRGAWLIPLCAGTITFSAGILVTIFCNPLLALFTRDAAVLDFAMRYIHIVLPFTWMYAVMNVIMCFSNGIGEIKYPTTVNLFILWGVRIPVAYLLSQIGYGGYAMASVPLSFLSGMILMLFYFRTKRWAELRALAKNEP